MSQLCGSLKAGSFPFLCVKVSRQCQPKQTKSLFTSRLAKTGYILIFFACLAHFSLITCYKRESRVRSGQCELLDILLSWKLHTSEIETRRAGIHGVVLTGFWTIDYFIYERYGFDLRF